MSDLSLLYYEIAKYTNNNKIKTISFPPKITI